MKKIWVFPIALALTHGLQGCGMQDQRTLATDDLSAYPLAAQQILLTVNQEPNIFVAPVNPAGKTYVRRPRYRGSPHTERTLNQIAQEYDLRRIDGWLIGSLSVYCEVFQVPGGHATEDVIARLAADTRVESVQGMNIFRTQSASYNDPYLGLQSAIHTMRVTEAHTWATGKGVKVAVVDTGIEIDHPDLRDRIYLTRNFVADSRDDTQHDQHGTAVAGIIAATLNNGLGIVGVAPEVEILSLRACWEGDDESAAALCSSFTLAKALEYAVSSQTDILNLSLAGPQDPILSRLLNVALDRGIIIVTASAGSDAGNNPFPASVPGVIAVRSSHDGDSPHSNPESALKHIAAPGHNILTTAPNGSYAFYSGSSLAAAHVSGIVALLVQREPGLSSRQADDLLRHSSIVVGEGEIVNACNALAQLLEVTGCREVVATR